MSDPLPSHLFPPLPPPSTLQQIYSYIDPYTPASVAFLSSSLPPSPSSSTVFHALLYILLQAPPSSTPSSTPSATHNSTTALIITYLHKSLTLAPLLSPDQCYHLLPLLTLHHALPNGLPLLSLLLSADHASESACKRCSSLIPPFLTALPPSHHYAFLHATLSAVPPLPPSYISNLLAAQLPLNTLTLQNLTALLQSPSIPSATKRTLSCHVLPLADLANCVVADGVANGVANGATNLSYDNILLLLLLKLNMPEHLQLPEHHHAPDQLTVSHATLTDVVTTILHTMPLPLPHSPPNSFSIIHALHTLTSSKTLPMPSPASNASTASNGRYSDVTTYLYTLPTTTDHYDALQEILQPDLQMDVPVVLQSLIPKMFFSAHASAHVSAHAPDGASDDAIILYSDIKNLLYTPSSSLSLLKPYVASMSSYAVLRLLRYIVIDNDITGDDVTGDGVTDELFRHAFSMPLPVDEDEDEDEDTRERLLTLLEECTSYITPSTNPHVLHAVFSKHDIMLNNVVSSCNNTVKEWSAYDCVANDNIYHPVYHVVRRGVDSDSFRMIGLLGYCCDCSFVVKFMEYCLMSICSEIEKVRYVNVFLASLLQTCDDASTINSMLVELNSFINCIVQCIKPNCDVSFIQLAFNVINLADNHDNKLALVQLFNQHNLRDYFNNVNSLLTWSGVLCDAVMCITTHNTDYINVINTLLYDTVTLVMQYDYNDKSMDNALDCININIIKCYSLQLSSAPFPGSYIEYVIMHVMAGDRLGERVCKLSNDLLGKCCKTYATFFADTMKCMYSNGLSLGYALIHKLLCCCIGTTTVSFSDTDTARDMREWYVNGLNHRSSIALLNSILQCTAIENKYDWYNGIQSSAGRYGEGVCEWIMKAFERGEVNVKFWFVVGKVCRNEETLENGRKRTF
jgi:hypothetical protein